MEQLLELDKKLFLELNSGFHTHCLDQLMLFFSSTAAWIPLYLVLLYLIIRNYRKETWMVLLAITLTIVMADQFTSTFMKPFFERLRPSHDPELENIVHIVNHYRAASKFGFASSHAANTFGIATLMWFILKNYRPLIGLLFPWAIGVGYTRIYLGVHFPGDILVGELVGFLSALIAWLLFKLLKRFIDEKKTLSIRD